MTDLRKDKRAPASLKVKYKSTSVEEFAEQNGLDVSRGGIFIKTKKPIENGALLKLELQLNDASPVIHGIGRVCWRREPGPDPELPAGMGIKFIKLDPESRQVVERIVLARGEVPSRFDRTLGAELAAPSTPGTSLSPTMSAAPAKAKTSPPATASAARPAATPLVAKPAGPAQAVAAPAVSKPAAAAAPAAPAVSRPAAASPVRSAAAPVTSTTPRAPLTPARAPAATAAAAAASTARAPAAASAALPAARAPATAPAPRAEVPKPAAPAPKPTSHAVPPRPSSPGAAAVAGLFAGSPLSDRGAPGTSIEPSLRGSFFQEDAEAGGSDALGAGRVSPQPSFTPAFTPAPTPKPTAPSFPGPRPSQKVDRARQSGQFLAAALAEGGVAEETATQARVAAEGGEDALIDELFAEADTKPRISPAPAPLSARGTPAPTPAKAEAGVEDVFAELSAEEGLSSSAKPGSGMKPGAGGRMRPSATAPTVDSVDALFAEIDEREQRGQTSHDAAASAPSAPNRFPPVLRSEPPASEPPLAIQSRPPLAARGEGASSDFGEAELFAPSSAPPALPLTPEDGGFAPSVPAAAQKSTASRPPPGIIAGFALFVVLCGIAAFLYYQRQIAPMNEKRALAARQAGNAPPAANAAPQAQANAAPAPSTEAPAPAPSAPPSPAATPKAEAPAGTATGETIEVEVSSLPRESDIAVDGKHVGTTPKHVALPLGREVRVSVSSSGYATMTRPVLASAGMEPLRFKLEPLPYALVVRSTPPDAEVSVGQKTVASPTPLELGHLDGGIQVSIAKDGYQRMTRLVRIDEFSEKDGVMRAELEVTLSALPPGAASSHSHAKRTPHAKSEGPPAPSSGESAAPAAEPGAAPAETPPPVAIKPSAEPEPAPAAPSSAPPPPPPPPE